MQESKPELSTKKQNEHSQVRCVEHQVFKLFSHAESMILHRIFIQNKKQKEKTNDSLIVKITFFGEGATEDAGKYHT
jgi:hypothetical protein